MCNPSAVTRLAAFDGLLRHSADSVLLLDGEGRILKAGRAFAATYARGNPRGRRLSRYLDRGSVAKARAALEQLRGGPQAVELDLVTADREIRLVHFSFCRVHPRPSVRLSGPAGRYPNLALNRPAIPGPWLALWLALWPRTPDPAPLDRRGPLLGPPGASHGSGRGARP